MRENLVERFLHKAGFKRNTDYSKEVKTSNIESQWHLDMSAISNSGKSEKRFDFAVKIAKAVWGIETNFYASVGSKLNETARSYKQIAQEAKLIDGFEFAWITDGRGWKSARHNLEETFDVMEHLYNISDLENGALEEVFW